MPAGIEPGVEGKNNDGLLTYVPFEKTPAGASGDAGLAQELRPVEAVEELHDCLVKLEQPGVMPLDVPAPLSLMTVPV